MAVKTDFPLYEGSNRLNRSKRLDNLSVETLPSMAGKSGIFMSYRIDDYLGMIPLLTVDDVLSHQ